MLRAVSLESLPSLKAWSPSCCFVVVSDPMHFLSEAIHHRIDSKVLQMVAPDDLAEHSFKNDLLLEVYSLLTRVSVKSLLQQPRIFLTQSHKEFAK